MKYKKEFAEQLPAMFANGEDVSEVALLLGVTRRTFYHWIEKHKEFAEAYEQGKLASEAWWCKLGRAGATGKINIQPSVWIFNMKNKFGYRDQPTNDDDGQKAQPIKIEIVRENGRATNEDKENK
jgi:hypothetical protein